MILDAVVAAVVCALLFVLFGALRPVRRCSGHCGTCHDSCKLRDEETR